MQTTLIMAQTLDGRIARHTDEFIGWTGAADKQMFAQLTRRAGVVIMGAKTFATLGRPLPERRNIVLTRTPNRDSKTNDLTFTDLPPQQLLKELEQQGHTQVALIGGMQTNTLFARAGLIDEFFITLTPHLFGCGLSLFCEPLDLALELVSSTLLEKDTLLLHYRTVA